MPFEREAQIIAALLLIPTPNDANRASMSIDEYASLFHVTTELVRVRFGLHGVV
jgi:hypothetical protein